MLRLLKKLDFVLHEGSRLIVAQRCWNCHSNTRDVENFGPFCGHFSDILQKGRGDLWNKKRKLFTVKRKILG